MRVQSTRSDATLERVQINDADIIVRIDAIESPAIGDDVELTSADGTVWHGEVLAVDLDGTDGCQVSRHVHVTFS